MNKKFKKILAVTAVMAIGVAGVASLAACGGNNDTKKTDYTFEAEDAEFGANTVVDISYADVTFDRTTDNAADGATGPEATFIESFGSNGQTTAEELIWKITSDKECDATLTLHAASAAVKMNIGTGWDDMMNWTYEGVNDVKLKDNAGIALTNNGTAVTWGEDATIEGLAFDEPIGLIFAMTWPFHITDTATCTIHLVEGENKVVLSTTTAALNVDKIVITTDANLTFTKADHSTTTPDTPDTPVVSDKTFEAEQAVFGEGTVATVNSGEISNGTTASWVENFGGLDTTTWQAKGGELIWNITSDKDCDVTLTLYAASQDLAYNESFEVTAVNAVKLAEKTDVVLKVGDTVISWGDAELGGITYETPVGFMDSAKCYRYFTSVTVNIHLTAGVNKISLATGTTSLNVDKIVISTDANLTFTATDHTAA